MQTRWLGFRVSREVVLNTRILTSLLVDSGLRKAYVPYDKRDHSGGVLMIDIDKSTIVEDIAFHSGGSSGAAALDEKNHLLYVADSDDSIAVLDGGTGKRLRTVSVASGSSALALDSTHGVLYSVNSNDSEIRVVNPETGDVTAVIPTPFFPSTLIVDEANHRVFGASTGGEKGGDIVTIDTDDNSVVATADVKGSDGGLALDTRNHRLLASSSYYGVISAIDVATGKVATVFSDFETPHSMLQCAGALFVANRDPGDIVIADASDGHIAQTLSVGTHPEAIAADTATGDVWVLSDGDTARSVRGLLSVLTHKA